MNIWRVYVDGLVKNNQNGPGKAAIGLVITKNENTVLEEGVEIAEPLTNNEAEWLALLYGVRKVMPMIGGKDEVFFLSDSNLVISQMNGMWRMNKEFFRQARQRVLEIMGDARRQVYFVWVKRDRTKMADALANGAINHGEEVRSVREIIGRDL